MTQGNALSSKPVGVNAIGLMDALGKAVQAYNTIKGILEIFGIGAEAEPSLQDLIGQIINEVRDVFKQELANEDLRTAAATLQTVQNFIMQNYANAVNNQENNQQLYTRLTQDNAAPSVSNFDTIINKITSWAKEYKTNPNVNSQSIACQALSFSLTSYYYLALIYKERAKRYWTASADPDARKHGSNTEWANMQSTATNAINQLEPILDAFTKFRLSCIILKDDQTAIEFLGTKHLCDTYLPDSRSLWVDPPKGFLKAMGKNIPLYIDAYKQALKTGSDADMAALKNTLQRLEKFIVYLNIDGSIKHYNSVKDDVQRFGKWHKSATDAIETFRKMEKDVNPYV